MKRDANPESAEAIAHRLELTRRALGQSNQTTFAQSIGITSQAWSNYLAGTRISVDTAIRMCRLYSVTLDWIFRGNTYGMPPSLVSEIQRLEGDPPAPKLGRRKKLPNQISR